MRGIKGKGGLLVLLSVVLTLSTGMTAMAAKSVKIRLENETRSNWSEDIKEPKVTINYEEVSPEWSKSIDDWVPGKTVSATFTISGEYVKSDCSVTGGELVSAKAADGETTIKVNYVPVAQFGAPESAGWSDATKTKASWKKVPYASKYQLRLYREDQWIKTLTTNYTALDLVEYMQDGHSYYYEVRAIAKNSTEEKYLKDGEFTVSDDSVVQELGDTSGRWSTTQNGKQYREGNGSYASNGWLMISGKWYYFNQDGYAQTGWQYLDNKWYYMNGDGEMTTGWQSVGGKWYYLNADGSMATGWIQAEPGKWYFLNEDGSMAADTVIDGTYRVDGSGQWVP